MMLLSLCLIFFMSHLHALLTITALGCGTCNLSSVKVFDVEIFQLKVLELINSGGAKESICVEKFT
jgi:hypothetical protein